LMNVFENKIAPTHNIVNKMVLNDIVFLIDSGKCYGNTFGINCARFTFGDNCFGNTFGDECIDNIFGNKFELNTFGNGCQYNIFDLECIANAFGSDCNGNAFNGNCSYNTFGNGCQDNIFDSICNNNILENNCTYLKGTYTYNINNSTYTCTHHTHVLAGCSGTSEEPCILPAKEDSNKSVTYVGLDGGGNIATWVPAEVHAQSGK